jgi:RND family efflux transporter MFP subunit
MVLGLMAMPAVAQTEPDLPSTTSPAKQEGGEIRALLVPASEATLSSQIAAQIQEIRVKDGERFKKGDILIMFDCAVNRAELRKAQAELQAASKTYSANQQLIKHQAVSKLELAISAAEVSKASAQVSLAKAKVEMCEVRAPFNGRVVKVQVKPFESYPVAQPLISILDDTKLKMELFVPSNWLLWLKPGQKFTVTIDETGKTYPANITGIGARVDAVSQTLALTSEIVGSHPELLSGMSGVAQFQVPEQP